MQQSSIFSRMFARERENARIRWASCPAAVTLRRSIRTAMTDYPPSRVRVVSHEPISASEMKITLEIVIDVHRMAEVGQQFISEAAQQIRQNRERES
jgi:hypothetical protein